jgi:signal peptidase I
MSRALDSVWQFVKQVAIVTPIVVTFTDLVAGAVKVRGESMQPTLNPEERMSEDRVLLDKFSVWGYKYRRGDVVVLR